MSGGAIKAEYRVKYVIDRVETTSTIWMGLTTGCAACHDHKYDPISMREFYELFAFFNNTTEDVMDGNAKANRRSSKCRTRSRRCCCGTSMRGVSRRRPFSICRMRRRWRRWSVGSTSGPPTSGPAGTSSSR